MRFHSGETNDLIKWVCRIVGWLLTWLGMQMMVGPLTVFPDIVRPSRLAQPPPATPLAPIAAAQGILCAIDRFPSSVRAWATSLGVCFVL